MDTLVGEEEAGAVDERPQRDEELGPDTGSVIGFFFALR